VPHPAPHVSRRSSIWDREHFPVTTGSILAFTIIAFQGLALATVAPVVAEDIGGRDLYGWIFTAFLLPQIVGTVFAGREVDRHSPGRVFAIHLVMFTVGCVVAGAAPSITWLFMGRAIQGFGAGGLSACVYAVLSRAYEDELRPSILAATSAAWVVPSLIGPAIAGFVAEEWSWRWAFFGLLPILAIVAPLTLPSYLRIQPVSTKVANDRRLWFSFGLAISTGLFLAGLDIRPWQVGAALAAVGLAGLAPPWSGSCRPERSPPVP
jgi:MFS family permease